MVCERFMPIFFVPSSCYKSLSNTKNHSINILIQGVGYHLTGSVIDTTFAMYRRNTAIMRKPCPCARALAPYMAVHLDWYHDSNNLPEEKLYYLNHQTGANSWR